MHVLFVHGMGRTSLSAWPMLMRLRAHGIPTHRFGYSAAFQSFTGISERLAQAIAELAKNQRYVLIGHSLGGVLLRAALSKLPPGTNLPVHIFLLGSPVQVSRLARIFHANPLYRLLTGDCGALLGSSAGMAGIVGPPAPTTSFVGVQGLRGRLSPFRGELNDGVVSVSEVSAEWIGEEIRVPVVHTWLPASRSVADIIVERVERLKIQTEIDFIEVCSRSAKNASDIPNPLSTSKD